MRRSGWTFAAALVLAFIGAPAAAQDYPAGPVKVVMPVAAGGAGDLIMRMLMAVMETRTLKPIILEHRPGAGGNIAAEYVVNAKPDGHTLLLAVANNLVANQFLFKDMKFDPLTALLPITLVADIPSVVFVSARISPATLKDFVAYAKTNPGKINYGSAGIGTSLHLAGAMLGKLAGLEMVHVPYRGVAPAITDMLSGQIHLMIVGYNVGMPHVRPDGIRALAAASDRRLPAAPDLPTAAEAGLPGFVIGNWWGLVGPKGLDPGIAATIQREFRFALDDPKVRTRFADLGITPIGNTPAEFAAFIRTELPKWESAVKASGITPQ